MIRLAMNLVPAFVLLVWREKFTFTEGERRLWLLFALISLALFGVFLVSPSSTAVDRIALYMLPLQLVIFAHLPDVLSEESETDVSVPLLGVLGFYGLVAVRLAQFRGSLVWVATLSFLSPGSSVLKVVLFANTEWYLYNFRRSLASALRDAGHEVLLLSPPGPYGEKLRALGFRWLPAPMERLSLNPLRELALVNWLRDLVRDEQVDLVHGFTIKCAVYGSLASRLGGVPARVNAVAGMGYVFSSNDLKATVLRPVVRTMMHLALGGKSARLILQNPDDVGFFERARVVDRGTIRLIPGSGVDCRRFVPNGGRQRGERFRVLLPARLLWDKGVAEYVEAARRLHAEQGGHRFPARRRPGPRQPGSGARGAGAWLGGGRLAAVAGPCGRYAGLVRCGRCGRLAQLPGRLAEGLDRGRRRAACRW